MVVWVTCPERIEEVLLRVVISLCGRNGSVAKRFLHNPDVSTESKEHGGRHMPDHVRSHPRCDSGDLGCCIKDSSNALCRYLSACCIHDSLGYSLRDAGLVPGILELPSVFGGQSPHEDDHSRRTRRFGAGCSRTTYRGLCSRSAAPVSTSNLGGRPEKQPVATPIQ